MLRRARVAATLSELSAFEAAFVHESAAREGLAAGSNERLEFRGDAALGFVVARYLYERYPEAAAGELALRKAALVSDAALATSAQRLGFADLMLLGAGLAKLPPVRRRSALADAFEAFIAALESLAGVEAAARFVLTQHVPHMDRPGTVLDDPKTTLQEWTQKRFAVLPRYVDRYEGPAHERTFFAEVTVDDDISACGSGPSKKAAERAAATAALEGLKQRYGELPPRTLSQPLPAAQSLRRATSKGRRP
ncbi:MAG: ribonuclease III [Candidatus Eremiobacteraeota bacterium]|nr:ribonuclease III [Candidatus Eremiobacteraeota bacterium]MBC5822003.1 ribonuclease III [Candidatus Eremiobacteraeota bacterium]